jgi:hypothetical protein
MSPLNELASPGQVVWLDCVERKLLAEGGLHVLITHGGPTGVTSNPSIFEKGDRPRRRGEVPIEISNLGDGMLDRQQPRRTCDFFLIATEPA